MIDTIELNRIDAFVESLQKDTWKAFKFSDIAFNIVEKVTPKQSNLTHYIGLEHLDSGSIHIKRFGDPKSLDGDKLKIYKGDVIVGKRNAYLKRAAVAEFDAIASAHSFVLRANSEVILPVLFPFLMLSDKFWETAIRISVGSLSPTINWKSLAIQEFRLPPQEQQAKIAEMLWAIDHVIQSEHKLSDTITNAFRSYVKTFLKKPILQHDDLIEIDMPTELHTTTIKATIPKLWQKLRLKDVIQDAQNGFAEGKRLENGLVQLRMNNVTREGTLNFDNAVKVPRRAGLDRYQIQEMDVLFNNTNSEELVGKTVIFEEIPFEIVFSNHFTRLRGRNDIILQKFLYLWLKYHFEIGLFRSRCTRWIGQAAVQTENLLSLTIILPTLKEQEIIVEITSKLENQTKLIQKQIEHSKLIYVGLINQIFS